MQGKVKIESLAGDVGIEQAHRIREELIAAFGRAETVILDLSRIESLDITVIQLILSASRYADATGKCFEIAGSLPDGVRNRFVTSGLCRTRPENGDDVHAALRRILTASPERRE